MNQPTPPSQSTRPWAFTPAPWSYSPQHGTPGHGTQAQVWGPDGKALADIKPTQANEEATATARLMAAAPNLLRQCIDVLFYLESEHRGAFYQGMLRKAIAKAVESEPTPVVPLMAASTNKQ